MVAVGDVVEIRNERDAQMAQLFGTEPAAGGGVTLAEAASGAAAGGQ
jgi:hypothetical protein